MLRNYLALTLMLISSLLFGKEFKPYYYKANIKNGDGVSTLLARYNLSSHDCNIQKFYELNDLSKKSQLKANKEYLLPIKVYKYNGKSIRSTLKIDEVEVAKEIQSYNEALHKRGLRKESFLKSNLLWVPSHFLECEKNETKNESTNKETSKKEETKTDKKSELKTEVVEIKKSKRTSSEVKINDLFGPKYREVNMFDDQLKGQVFYVSSGHGGPDPGAMCTELEKTLCEDEYAYDVSLRLARDLTQHGAIVHMIIQDENDGIRDDAFLDCDKDETCNSKEMPYRQLDRLKQNSDHINRLYEKYKAQGVKKQTCIIIHVDSANKEHRQDVFFYHYGNNETSKQMAYDLKSTFEEKYETFQSGRGYKGYVANRGLYLLRHVKPNTVFVELANIRNHSDHIRLMESSNRQALANWMFEGLTGIK